MQAKGDKVVGYMRVSGLGQVNGTGFDRQAEAIKGFCKQRRWDLETLYRESHTGTEENRPTGFRPWSGSARGSWKN